MPLLNRFYAWLLVIASFVSIDQYAKHTKYQLKNRTSQATELERIDQNRLASYSTVANKLACLSDVQLAELISSAAWSAGYGETATINMDGITVFIKKIPLTDFETRSENIYSTANLFHLPLFYQYGVGSAGFGAFRELAAQTMASNWVLTAACKNFPLLYHSRILHHSFFGESIAQDKIDERVRRWNDSSGVRHRLESMNQATSSVVVFLENIPQTLHGYLTEQIKQGPDQFNAAVKMCDQQLQETASFMKKHGMIHFDAHGNNIMTDGYRLYFADFGLTISSQFDLSEEENAFFDQHKNYDKVYVQSDLVFEICEALQTPEDDFVLLLQRYVDGDTTITYSPYITSVLQKYAHSALIMYDFIGELRKKSKLTPYPAQEIARICAKLEE